jgi:hypothetical protein
VPEGVWRCAALPLLLAAAPAGAIVAGAPPDSPAARVDANRAESPFAGVGSIRVLAADGQGTAGIYSGCLVARRWVLTAGHVVSGLPAARLRFNLNLTGDLSHVLAVRQVVRHPNFRALPGQRYADDLALLELAEPAPATAPVYVPATAALRAGTVLTLVGYGASGSGAGGETVPGQAQVRRVALNSADVLEIVPPMRVPQVYLFDFDGPMGKGFLGGSTLGNALEGTLAGGDSGSPALLRDATGDWRLAGVGTFVFGLADGPPPPRFGSGGGGMLVAPYAGWIADTIGAGSR